MSSLHASYPRLHEETAIATRTKAGVASPQGVARLSLFINGTAYQVQRIRADAVAAFRLRKFDGTEYDIAQTEQGIACDCPDYTFHREGIDPEGCKHIKALVACGLIERADQPTPVLPSARADREFRTPAPSHGRTIVIANGQPVTFLEQVEHEAMGFRAWNTSTGKFLANQLDRLAQLIRWTGARTPEDHEDRMEIYDRELRERHYDQGYQDGLEAARREARPTTFHPEVPF